MSTEKFCVKCGKKFLAMGREVICPACKAHAAEEAKKAAVLRAKKASWMGESVPVRISGRASTVIRVFGKSRKMTFAMALDALLQSTAFFANLGQEWSAIQPYKSRRLKKSGEQDAPQDTPPSKPQAARAAKTVKTASKAAKTSSKTASKATSKK